eukprot:4053442-Amphidinium_carterae.1
MVAAAKAQLPEFEVTQVVIATQTSYMSLRRGTRMNTPCFKLADASIVSSGAALQLHQLLHFGDHRCGQSELNALFKCRNEACALFGAAIQRYLTAHDQSPTAQPELKQGETCTISCGVGRHTQLATYLPPKHHASCILQLNHVVRQKTSKLSTGQRK